MISLDQKGDGLEEWWAVWKLELLLEGAARAVLGEVGRWVGR